MKNLKTVNIIGGGIGGLSTALTLKNLGINYSLFERSAALSYENVGLGISANIFPILEKWQLLEETKNIGTEIRTFYFVDNNLNYINSFKLQNPALSVNRKLFYQILTKHLGTENINLGSTKSVNDFPENEIVVAAEGICSPTRQAWYPDLKLRNANQILWRGISQIELDEKFKNSYHSFVGGNLRFAIIHTGENYYSWYAIRQNTSDVIVTCEKAKLKALFEKYHPIVKDVLEKSENIYSSNLMDINPARRKKLSWFLNNKIIVGDAIHPTTPNMANGACLAMEDGYLLANLLKNDNLTLPEIFGVFQKRRSKKVNTIVVQSWQFGKLLHRNGKIINFFIKLGIRMTPQFIFDQIYSNILVEVNVDS